MNRLEFGPSSNPSDRKNSFASKVLNIARRTSILVLPLIAVTACNSEEIEQDASLKQDIISVSPTPSSIEIRTLTPTKTPEEVQERLEPFTSIPNVPWELRNSVQSIYEYFITQRLTGNRLRLVENDVYDLDVFKTGTGETNETYSLIANIKNPKNSDMAIETRNQICRELVDATGSAGLELSIKFGVKISNAGTDPMGELGFSKESADEFLAPTNCGNIINL